MAITPRRGLAVIRESKASPTSHTIDSASPATPYLSKQFQLLIVTTIVNSVAYHWYYHDLVSFTVDS